MKPLPPEPLTDEDRAAWFDWQVSRRREWVRDWLLWGALENLSFASDRRDATLMLGAQLQPQCVVHWRNGLDHLILLRGPPAGERLEWLE
jgi:hypothetical protein